METKDLEKEPVEQLKLKVGARYIHNKTSNEYTIISITKMKHPDTGEWIPAVIYKLNALALPEFAGRFNFIRYNLYTDTGRQEARSVGISDAPTAYCNGDILRGVQSDYTIRKYLRKLLG